MARQAVLIPSTDHVLVFLPLPLAAELERLIPGTARRQLPGHPQLPCAFLIDDEFAPVACRIVAGDWRERECRMGVAR